VATTSRRSRYWSVSSRCSTRRCW